MALNHARLMFVYILCTFYQQMMDLKKWNRFDRASHRSFNYGTLIRRLELS